MDATQILEIIAKKNNLDSHNFEKSKSGFNNVVFVSNEYVLKIMPNNIKRYSKELFIYQTNKNKKIPSLIDTGTIDGIPYLLISRGKGRRIYEIWHLLNVEERRKLIKQIADLICEINNLDATLYIRDATEESFSNKVITSIYLNIEKLKSDIDHNLREKIKKFVYDNKDVLSDENRVIVYPDMHFDNILVDDNCNITTIYDFEDIEYSPNYVVLDIFKRMEKYPHLHANEHDEKNIKREDYKNINNWLKEDNPDLFNHNDLDIKLRLLALEYDLKQYVNYPNHEELLKRIYEDIDFESAKDAGKVL